MPSSDFQLKRSSLSDRWGREERRGEERRGEERRGEERRGEERRGSECNCTAELDVVGTRQQEVRNTNKHVPEEAGAVGLYLLVFGAVDPPIRCSSGRCIRVSWPTHQQTATPPTGNTNNQSTGQTGWPVRSQRSDTNRMITFQRTRSAYYSASKTQLCIDISQIFW